jgi:hypothetical protein
MANTPNFNIPVPSDGDPADFAAELDAVVNAIDTNIEAAITAKIAAAIAAIFAGSTPTPTAHVIGTGYRPGGTYGTFVYFCVQNTEPSGTETVVWFYVDGVVVDQYASYTDGSFYTATLWVPAGQTYEAAIATGAANTVSCVEQTL